MYKKTANYCLLLLIIVFFGVLYRASQCREIKIFKSDFDQNKKNQTIYFSLQSDSLHADKDKNTD
jgi:hypothetical protein